MTVIEELRAVVLSGETCIGYPELARRLAIDERHARRLVAQGKIKPLIRGARTVRFHWPSVVAQLQEAAKN